MDMNKLDEYEQDDDEEQFILVTDPTDNEPVEILLSKDGTCSLTTLEHAFPRAYGLKYKNPSTGAKRVVRLDESGKNFIAPADGWSGKTFEIIFKSVEQSSSKHEDKSAMMKDDEDVKKKTALELGTKRKIDDEKGGEEEVRLEDSQQKGKKDGEESEGGRGVELYENRTTEEDREGGVKKMKRMPQTAVELKLDRSGKECVDLICMGLPYDLEEWALQAHFEQFGEVDFREIKRKSNGEARGFGFVRMVRYSSQVLVLSQPKHIIGGRECSVRISLTDNVRFKEYGNYLEKMVESTQMPRLFIGGLNEEIYRKQLEGFFTEQIHRFDKDARIRDMYYPRPFRGFAFLTIDSVRAAKELVRQSDFLLDGHHCVVTIASPKYPQQQPNEQSMSRQQPWAGRQPPSMAPPYSMYEPRMTPPNEMMFPRNEGAGMGGGRGASSRYDEYAPRGGGGGGPPPFQPEYQMRFEPRRPDVFDFDSMDTVDSFFQAGVRSGLAQMEADQASTRNPGRGGPRGGGNGANSNNVWMGGNIPAGGGGGRPSSRGGGSGGGNIPPEQVQAVLRQLPGDAVETALKMLQSMIGGRQENNGQPDEF